MSKVNKLVRDNIPDIITNSGRECEYEILDLNTYLTNLKEKLIEEAIEVQNSLNNSDLIEELADVIEVIETIIKSNNLNFEKIIEKKNSKAMEKGKFEKRIYLRSIK